MISMDEEPPRVIPRRGGRAGIDALREDLILGKITQGYGRTPYAIAHPEIYPPGGHEGVDIVLPHGPSGEGPAIVHSPFSGYIEQVQDTGSRGYGKNVVVRSAQGYTVLVGHLHDFERFTGDPNSVVREGQDVWAGEPIGHMGATGSATGAHVHYRFRGPRGEHLDPTLGLPANASDRGLDARYGSNVWYTDYHNLGFGQGDNPGQEWRSQAPSPGQTLPRPTTLINGRLNPNPGISQPGEGDPRVPPDPEPTSGGSGSNCPQGPEVAKDAQGRCPPGYQPADGFYMDPSQQPCVCSSTYSAFGPFGANFDLAQTLVTIGLMVVGAAFVTVGLVAFTKEQPVAAVVQPVVDTAKGAGKVAAVVAK